MNFHKQNTPVLIKAFIKSRVITGFQEPRSLHSYHPASEGTTVLTHAAQSNLAHFWNLYVRHKTACALLSGVLGLMLGLGDARLLVSPWCACPGHPWATGVTRRVTGPLHRRWGQCLAIVKSATSNVLLQPSNCFPKLYQFMLLPEMYGVLAVRLPCNLTEKVCLHFSSSDSSQLSS